MQNPSRKMNTLFLIMIVLYVALSIGVSMLAVRSIRLPEGLLLAAGEIAVLFPGLCFLLLFRCDLKQWMPFRKVHILTALQGALMMVVLMPAMYFLNMLSQLFERNVVTDMLTGVDQTSPLMLFLIVGILGPVVEEVVFRGILLSGYRRTGRILGAILWTGLLFGLYHMNLNQFGYAMLIGIASAFMVESTGSLIPSIIMHCGINSINVLELYGIQYVMELAGTDFQEEYAGVQETLNNAYLVRMAGTLAIPAVIGIVIAVVVLISMARREGRLEYLQSILPKKKASPDSEVVTRPGMESENDSENTEQNKMQRIITPIGVIAVILCIGIIFGLQALLNILQ